VIAPDATVYTIVGFDIQGNPGQGIQSGLGKSSFTEIYCPPTLNCILPKNCFRGISNLTKLVFDPLSSVTGSSPLETSDMGGYVFFDSTRLQYLDFPATFYSWGREYFGPSVPDTVIIRNPNKVINYYSAKRFTTASKSHNIYVPDHLVSAYQAIP
jgi:hypothetical protein